MIEIMKRILLLFLGLLFTQFSVAEESGSDPKRVEFFEKLYKVKIEGVKPLEEYDDPDAFYAAIAKQVGIPKKAFDAVEKKYGWKQNDEFFLTAMVKGGWDGNYWGVMVTKIPAALKKAKSKEEKMKLLEGMEMKMVLIGFDGAVSFPKEPDAAEQGGADQPATAPKTKPEDKATPKSEAKERPQ
jgi:hypothetical protein